MSNYERGDLTTATAIGPALEIRAGAGEPMYIQELGLFLTAATASSIGFGRPANSIGAGGTVGLGSADLDPDDVPSVGGVVLSGQTTVPTAPTIFKRQIVLAGTIGNGIMWTWPAPGLRVKQNTSVVLWNIAINSALRTYIRWSE